MKLRMDRLLREQLELRGGCRRLGRNREIAAQELAIADILCELESRGDAIRYLDRDGRMAWRATPRLRDYIDDLQRDAEADLESESD
jgi:hypothetical protein